MRHASGPGLDAIGTPRKGTSPPETGCTILSGYQPLDFLATVYHRQAETYFQEGRQAEAIAVLEQALAIAQAIDWRSEIALSHLLLGEAWLAKHKPDEAEVTPPEKALRHLQTARDQFAEMGMLIEQAACQVRWVNISCRTRSSQRRARPGSRLCG